MTLRSALLFLHLFFGFKLINATISMRPTYPWVGYCGQFDESITLYGPVYGPDDIETMSFACHNFYIMRGDKDKPTWPELNKHRGSILSYLVEDRHCLKIFGPLLQKVISAAPLDKERVFDLGTIFAFSFRRNGARKYKFGIWSGIWDDSDQEYYELINLINEEVGSTLVPKKSSVAKYAKLADDRNSKINKTGEDWKVSDREIYKNVRATKDAASFNLIVENKLGIMEKIDEEVEDEIENVNQDMKQNSRDEDENDCKSGKFFVSGDDYISMDENETRVFSLDKDCIPNQMFRMHFLSGEKSRNLFDFKLLNPEKIDKEMEEFELDEIDQGYFDKKLNAIKPRKKHTLARGAFEPLSSQFEVSQSINPMNQYYPATNTSDQMKPQYQTYADDLGYEDEQIEEFTI